MSLIAARELRVRCLSTGVVRPKRRARGIRRYLPGGWSEDALPVNAFLVEHPAGLCLFDAGQTARAASPGYLPGWHPFLRLARFELVPADEVASQLRELGHEPSAVRWVVLSHLHTDHVGGLEPFAHANVMVTGTEWARATGIGGRLRGYVPQHWPRGLEPVLVEFDGPPVGPFAASHDLAGDGRLVLVPAPGHTAGHMALLVRESGRGYVLAGDLARTADEAPPEIARFCAREELTLLGAHDAGASYAAATE